ncbi:50S ribosomal protein L30 [Stagnimonas aquatica]|jgi:large subunit ribosomal protein L30|uniref:Large ribosomal subunit protein uL30 n=1 Tax=Stagnimonas aquatica TaxID=2689987 RepID=A0A3N0VH10_9GAMM|nr:50S ribosomal protein L30 [Stagnimonas aquatica]ROH91995.1 50S ribosomal protein L30 [Stagnimonas aquatica]TAJ50551.1 MAG: 50S ribosomal protein L30 [Nevskiaceae bacterium]TAM29206.1 MAG: 50S ribosomal protein L30 [Nevskiaceae bacterium]
MTATTKQIKVTLVRSLAAQLKMHRNCVNGLGLTRMHQSVIVSATPENLGMVNKSRFMLKVEEVN